MKWPFGPPHLTLKPSKKQNKKAKKNKTNTTKTTKKRKTKKEKIKNTQKYQKRAFQLSVNFWQGIQKLPFLTPWPRKRAPKNTIKIGVSAYFLEKSYATRNGHLWTKKPKFRNSSYHFFLPFFSFNNKNTKICWNPYFYSVLANLKKDNFPKNNLKHRNLKNPFFAPFFEKGYF